MDAERQRNEIFQGLLNILAKTPEVREWEAYVTADLRRYRPGGTQYYREKRAWELLGLTDSKIIDQKTLGQPPIADKYIQEGRRLRAGLEHVAAEVASNHGFKPDDPTIRSLAVYYVNEVIESLDEK